MDLGLQDKVALVTGATANIGRAIALDLAAEGTRLVFTGRDPEAAARVEREARSRGARDVLFVPTDHREAGSAVRLAEAVRDRFGGLDVLVNNVGGNHSFALFQDTDPRDWQKDLDITLGTVLAVTHACLPLMIGRPSGRIVNIGSTAAAIGDYALSLYTAAKGAIESFTRVLAKEVGAHGITVNCVAPYSTQAEDPAAYSRGSRFHPEQGFFTREGAKQPPEVIAKLVRQGVLGRSVARPEEVSAAVLYFASERAAFVTAQTLRVDGGTLL